jgi:hypothetical protein
MLAIVRDCIPLIGGLKPYNQILLRREARNREIL